MISMMRGRPIPNQARRRRPAANEGPVQLTPSGVMPSVCSGDGLLVYPARPAAARSAVPPGGGSMTGETPVLGTLAGLTAASVERNSLAPRGFMLVKMAALIPVDDRLLPISPTPRPPLRVGSPPMTSRVMTAVAPIAGTARVVSAGGKILRAWAWRSLWPSPSWPATATAGSSSNRADQGRRQRIGSRP